MHFLRRLILILFFTVCVASPLLAHAQTLTGAVLFAVDGAGNEDHLSFWTTSGGSSFKLFIRQGNQWLNTADFGIKLPLTPGTITLTFYAEPSSHPVTRYGLNLFFDNDTVRPGISCITLPAKEKAQNPAFIAMQGRSMRLDTSVTTGAGAIRYRANHTNIEVTAFHIDDPSVEKVDLVGGSEKSPSGTPDLVGTLTLRIIDLHEGNAPPTNSEKASLYKATSLVAHHGAVSSAMYSADGKWLLTCGGEGDRTVKVWKADGSLFSTLQETQPILAAIFSPDGRCILTSLGDNKGKVWSVKSLKVISTLAGHTGLISCMAFSPDGRTIATGSSDTTVRLWDTKTGKETLLLKGHTAAVTSVAFSPDGKWLVSSGQDGQARIWEVARKPVRSDGGDLIRKRIAR